MITKYKFGFDASPQDHMLLSMSLQLESVDPSHRTSSDVPGKKLNLKTIYVHHHLSAYRPMTKASILNIANQNCFMQVLSSWTQVACTSSWLGAESPWITCFCSSESCLTCEINLRKRFFAHEAGYWEDDPAKSAIRISDGKTLYHTILRNHMNAVVTVDSS